MIGDQPTFKVVNGEFRIDNAESYQTMLLRSFDTDLQEVTSEWLNDRVGQQSGKRKRKGVRPWNKRVWYAVPALRAEPFEDRRDAIVAARTHRKLVGKAQVELIHFPSRWQARKLENKHLMPIEVIEL